VGRTCFTPQAIQSAYDLGPLYHQGFDGRGTTIAIVDSYGSDTMAHDLHVFNQQFHLQSMCGEEAVTCTSGMPTFSVLHLQGSPATKAPPGKSNGTGQEDKSAWALEVALDVETSHAIAPQANILLVATPTAETLRGEVCRRQPPRERHLAELRLGRGCLRQREVAPEPA
jgi:subtilase family serine protease